MLVAEFGVGCGLLGKEVECVGLASTIYIYIYTVYIR
jgi:hypothetical protein